MGRAGPQPLDRSRTPVATARAAVRFVGAVEGRPASVNSALRVLDQNVPGSEPGLLATLDRDGGWLAGCGTVGDEFDDLVGEFLTDWFAGEE